MNTTIRKMQNQDREQVFEMMRVFYNSPAVHTNGSTEIYNNDIDNCLNSNNFLDGYVFENDGNIQGYGMLAKSFSTEFGKQCVWIEDLYIKDQFRGQGIGKQFFNYITTHYVDCIFRLEVEEENQQAIALYKKAGFETLPYTEMLKK